MTAMDPLLPPRLPKHATYPNISSWTFRLHEYNIHFTAGGQSMHNNEIC